MHFFLLLVLAGLEDEYWAGGKHDYQFVDPWDKYCRPSYRLTDMAMHARMWVFDQDQVLHDLELTPNNFTYQGIALVGPSTVGKGFTAKVLQENFTRPEYRKTMCWRETRRKSHIIGMLKNAYNCGQTLILVENKMPKDIHIATIINKLIFERKEFVIIYVFKVEFQQQNQGNTTEMQQLNELKPTHIVIFEVIW